MVRFLSRTERRKAMEHRTITPMRKITDSSLKASSNEFEKGEEENMLPSEKSQQLSSANALDTAKNECFRWRNPISRGTGSIEGGKAQGPASSTAHRPQRQRLHRWEFSVM